MTVSDSFIDLLLDQLRGMGKVSVRRLFGGAGLYAAGTIFALVSEQTLYLKVDETTRADFEAEGMQPFTYATKDGRHALVSYWRAPERLFDDPDEMLAWATRALAAARRSAAKTSSPKSRRKRPG
ncbi:MAG TPA: TfoX/Sxy family protein [Hyphomicrobiaceae bacterium]|nr:TfoX/Sxy family protein [Hyphomicrobiaceae bacterium]